MFSQCHSLAHAITEYYTKIGNNGVLLPVTGSPIGDEQRLAGQVQTIQRRHQSSRLRKVLLQIISNYLNYSADWAEQPDISG